MKRNKNSVLAFESFRVQGTLNPETIENFGRAYGNLILEVLSDDK